MGNSLEEEIIKNQIPIHIHSLITILKFIFLSCVVILISYDYIDYYKDYGIISYYKDDYYLKVKVYKDDYDYFINNDVIIIDNMYYNYEIKYKSDKLYIHNNKNYSYLYLKLDLSSKYKVSNYVVLFKLEKQKLKLYKYLLNLIGGNN